MDEGRSERAIDHFHLRGPEGTDSVVIDMVGNRRVLMVDDSLGA